MDSSAQVIVTQIRKLALFEFIDTKPFTDWVKETLGMETEDSAAACDFEDEELDCSEEQLESLRRLLQDQG